MSAEWMTALAALLGVFAPPVIMRLLETPLRARVAKLEEQVAEIQEWRKS